MESEKNLLKTKLESAETQISECKGTIESLQGEIRDLKVIIDELEHKNLEHERIRKYLHNEIQELKGNIRVFCRVRPLLKGESISDETCEISLPEDKNDYIELIQHQV
jgi:kinesin family protein C1